MDAIAFIYTGYTIKSPKWTYSFLTPQFNSITQFHPYFMYATATLPPSWVKIQWTLKKLPPSPPQIIWCVIDNLWPQRGRYAPSQIWTAALGTVHCRKWHMSTMHCSYLDRWAWLGNFSKNNAILEIRVEVHIRKKQKKGKVLGIFNQLKKLTKSFVLAQ